MKKGKVYIGLSGGVDSSVSATLLRQAGYDVTGVFIKVWQPDWITCTWKEDRLDAMRVAAQLDIPFITLDLEKEYKTEVVDYMIAEYAKGRTPNPDIMCNTHVKFGGFFPWAMKQGADFVATGHYAQIKKDTHGTQLLMGTDANKDQTYFLWTLTQEHISKTLFPVGHIPKEKVRKLARSFNLSTATKKDSQGLCFIGKIDFKEFLKHFIPEKTGIVRDEHGKEIGHHSGAVFFTIGERHGFTIHHTQPNDTPYYVIAKDIVQNELIVAHQPVPLQGSTREIQLESCNWNNRIPEIGKVYTARSRYRQALCNIRFIDHNTASFLEEPHILSPGQSLVVYDRNVCLGGGIIS